MTHESPRLRVMQFVTVFESGGSERQFINLGLALRQKSIDVRYGCLSRAGRLLHELEAHSVPVDEYRVRSLYSGRALWRARALVRDLARRQIDVVHAWNLYGNVFALPAARLAGVPVVVASVRDCGIYTNSWRRWVQRQACRCADVILVNAEEVKRWLVSDGYRADKIVVIGNGSDLSRFESPAENADVRTSLGLPEGVPLLSTIARLCPSKGIESSIDAMPFILARHPDARLLVAGEALKSRNGELVVDDEYRSALKARADTLGVGHRVLFLGYRSDAHALLQEVSVAMQPSLTEGLSNSIIEAMASARAVVATPVGGTPELIRHGVTGLLTPVSDPRALAEAACRLLADASERERLGAAARQFVQGRFSIGAMADATERVYLDLLARKRIEAGLQSSSHTVAAR